MPAIYRSALTNYNIESTMPNKSTYAQSRSQGMCPSHPKTPAVSGRATCQSCMDARKRLDAERKASGVCEKHRLPLNPACRRCVEQRAQKYESLKATKTCPRHPNVIVTAGVVHCDQCLAYGKNRRALAKANNCCLRHPKISVAAGNQL